MKLSPVHFFSSERNVSPNGRVGENRYQEQKATKKTSFTGETSKHLKIRKTQGCKPKLFYFNHGLEVIAYES